MNGLAVDLDHSISRPLEDPRLRVLSLGAGVQSSTIALMSARGELPPLDLAIFSDTQSEPRAVYAWLEWLEAELPFPVVRVTAGSLEDSVMNGAKWSDGRYVSVPFFLAGAGLGRRQCTKEYKIEPIIAEVRRRLDLAPRQRGPKMPVVEQWIGISTDEIFRLKHSRHRYIHHRWPLIEMRMKRWDCLRWMEERQYPRPPKSACTFCPFRSDEGWQDMKENAPEDFARAVAVDAAIRERGTLKRMRRPMFVHRSLKPLAEVDFTDPALKEQADLFGFNNECEGMCGV